MNVIDIGCGRGEILIQSALKGAKAWGIDYAWQAVTLAAESIRNTAEIVVIQNSCVQLANAKYLPFSDNWADVIFMLDVVEHLVPNELRIALMEARRVLKPGGRLIIHTMPNLWYYKFGYPLYRILQRIRGEKLPANPRIRWPFSHVHVNEQTPLSLKGELENQNYITSVWLRTTVNYTYEPNRVVRASMRFLTGAFPFRYVFCNDIFAVGIKDKI